MKAGTQHENHSKEISLTPSEIELQNQALEKIRKGLVGKKDKSIRPAKAGNKDKNKNP